MVNNKKSKDSVDIEMIKQGLVDAIKILSKIDWALLFAIFSYVIVGLMFAAGVINTSLFDDNVTEVQSGLSTLTNRTLFYSIVLPVFFLTIAFIVQAILLQRAYKNQLLEIKEYYYKESLAIKNISDLFSVMNSVQNNDLYSTILYTHLIARIKDDLSFIKEKKYFASGMYWSASNQFILSQKNLFCSCTLNPVQLIENDIQEYFDEQGEYIRNNKLDVKRVLMLDQIEDINKYGNFLLGQIEDCVTIYVIAKNKSKLVPNGELGTNDWYDHLKKDFAFAGDKYLMVAKIENNDLKGYEITEVTREEDVPKFINEIKESMYTLKEVKEYIDKNNNHLLLKKIDEYYE